VRVEDLADETFFERTAAHPSAWCLIRAEGMPVAALTWARSSDARVLLQEAVEKVQPPQVPVRDNPPQQGLTVVICTRGRAARLRLALGALARQTDSDFDVVVVDNAPEGDADTRAAVDGAELTRCRYVHEPTPGASHARNRGLAEIRTELSAWLDDDEVADPAWVHWVRQGFHHPSRPAAVCGVMLPAELETEAQVLFEQWGGFSKGRGLEPVVLRAGTPTVRSPLYPIPSFGAGGNMAFRTADLRALGGFDPCLGPGTLIHGGEETKVFSQLLRAGSAVLHWPPAITWHYHRRTMRELEQQFFGYTAGLPGFYLSMIRSSPGAAVDILALVPRGIGDILAHRREGGGSDLPEGFPPALLRASRKGLLQGVGLYLLEVRRQRSRRMSDRRRREVTDAAA